MTTDKRKHARLPLQSRVFVELEAPVAGDDGIIAVCRTLDVSSHGLRVALDHELTAGAYLQIGVEPAEGRGDTFFLVGRVCWCRAGDDADPSCLAGFELLPAENSDLTRWIELIGTMA